MPRKKYKMSKRSKYLLKHPEMEMAKWRIEFLENGEWFDDGISYENKTAAKIDAKTFAEGRKWRVVPYA